MKTSTLLAAGAAATLFAAFAYVDRTGLPLPVSDRELNACAARAALADIVAGGSGGPLPRQAAVDQLLLQYPDGDVMSEARLYDRTLGIGAGTTTQRYAARARLPCALGALLGRPVAMPGLSLTPGWHVSRWQGSAALVRDGSPEPLFSCMAGYLPTVSGCVYVPAGTAAPSWPGVLLRW